MEEYDALNVIVSNTGDGEAKDLKLSVEGPWQGEAVPVGDLGLGGSRSVSFHLFPQHSGPRVPIVFRLKYTDGAGTPQSLAHRDSLPVSGKDEARPAPAPVTIYVQQQQTGEGPILVKQTPGLQIQAGGSAAPQPAIQFCSQCGDARALPEGARFCPYCSAAVPTD